MSISQYTFDKFTKKYSPKNKMIRCVLCNIQIHINEDKHKCLFRRLTTKK